MGEIYWVEFPPRNGHAQAGRRPAIVAQDASATASLPTMLMIPLTTQVAALRFPGTVLIDANPETGSRRPSVALVFQLTVVDRRVVGARPGRIPDASLDRIWEALDRLMGRDG